MKKKVEIFGNCGKTGRRARAEVRMGFSMGQGAEHVEECPACQAKIRQAIERNPETTYQSIDSRGNVELKPRSRWW